MHNFVLHRPTKILFGKQTIPQIGAETANFGKTVLLVFGCGSARTNGSYQEAYHSLEEAGCSIVEYGGVTPNPTLEEVRDGIALFRDAGCNAICALGGGSVIDTAKAISCGALVSHDVWKFFTGKKRPSSAVPLTCISTIPGSGSESNSGMVVTHEERRQKFGYGNRVLFPKTAILDPEKTCSLSWELTSYGIIDTISHLAEYFCTNSLTRADVQEGLIISLIRSAMDCSTVLQKLPDDYSARAQIMWISSLAMGGLVSSGLGRIGFPMHLIEHSISARFDTPHGAGLSVVLPGWMKHMASVDPEKVGRLGENMFRLERGDTREAALQTAWQFKKLFMEWGCPVSLEELGVGRENVATLAADSFALARLWRLHRDYPPKIVERILNHCL